MLRLIVDAIRWIWWSWIASTWSGGGSGHPSYPAAKFNAWTLGHKLKSWRQGVIDYE